MAAQIGRYLHIYFDRALKTAGLIGRNRPDIIGIARWGKDIIVEVVSKSQTLYQMNEKCKQMIANNPNSAINKAVLNSAKVLHTILKRLGLVK